MSKNGNGKVKIDLAILHERVEKLGGDIMEMKEGHKQILTNHLPHIYEELTTIKVRLAYWAGALASLIIIIQIIVKFIK